MSTISRRNVLFAAGGGIVLSAFGYAALRAPTEIDLVRSLLERSLGPLNISDDHLSAFVTALRRRQAWRFPSERLADLAVWTQRVGLDAASRQLLPSDTAASLETFERWILGEFHALTDFAWRADNASSIQFTGISNCFNPFAVFTIEQG